MGCYKIITESYSKGGILIGVSAGAFQLGVKGYRANFKDKEAGFDTLLVPFIIDVHAEDEWANLSELLIKEGERSKGYGITSGAGIIYYPDMSLETVRYSCTEIISYGNEVRKLMICTFKYLFDPKSKFENESLCY